MGIQRFFDTGDLREIWHGFGDAFSAIPNSILRLWDQADTVATQLAEQAQIEASGNTEQSRAATSKFLIQTVGVFERALLENAFVNSVVMARDRYDRNPYAIPEMLENGEIKRQNGTGLPEPTSALQAYVDPDTGEVMEGYKARTGMEGELYNYAKNNAVFSMLMSLGTGMGDSTWLRKNMVAKEKKIELPEPTEAEAQALILSAMEGQGVQWRLSKNEIGNLIKNKAAANDEWIDAIDVEAEAERIYNLQSGFPELSVWTPEGQEVVNNEGAKAIFTGLQKGTVKIGDPALNGVFIPYEMREKVAREILQEIAQDAADLGLTEEQVGYVTRRYWFGDIDTGAPGLSDIINNKELPYTGTVRYNQLNVTYVMGPDGRPWATPFERTNLAQAFGIPIPAQSVLTGPGTKLDAQGKVVDEVMGINTGLHALEKVPVDVPEDIKIDMDDVVKKTNFKSSSGGRGYGRRGGGGGGYYGGPNFRDMRPLPGVTSMRDIDIPMINNSNPQFRRARTNRERVFSERGRLKQWQ
jgi:hypothetical protein